MWSDAGRTEAPGRPEILAQLSAAGHRATTPLVRPTGTTERVEGVAVPLSAALGLLAAVPADDAGTLPPSVAAWSLATKLALDLVARERITPLVRAGAAGAEAHWGVSLSLADDGDRFRRLALALPVSAYAVPDMSADELLLEFLDEVARVLTLGEATAERRGDGPERRADTPERRADTPEPRADPRARRGEAPERRGDAPGNNGRTRRRHAVAEEAAPERWERRLVNVLSRADADPVFLAAGVLERGLIDELAEWSGAGRGSLVSRAPRLALKLDAPEERSPWWWLGYFLQAADDPSLLLSASDVWSATDERLDWMGRMFDRPQEALLRELSRAARIFPPIEETLDAARPEAIRLDTAGAWQFLSEAAPALGEAGVSILLPAELAAAGQGRLRLRMRVTGGTAAAAGAVAGRGMALDQILNYRWEAALGDEPLAPEEFERLVALKRPLVRWRGQWVALDPSEIAEVRRAFQEGGGRVTARETLAAALGGTAGRDDRRMPVEVVVEGPFASLLERLREGAAPLPAPTDFVGELRPYQERGLGWLGTMAALGLGGCLADDMGLGKTIQAIAFLLARRQAQASDRRPALIVCPMSVVGNWERELARFAPTLPVIRHHGSDRARTPAALTEAAPHAVVVTTYGMLRRDRALLGDIDWAVAILDEAQNIKNAASQQAGAARSLRATHRFTMTGTPVENRLAELWSVLEFSVPGYLGPLEAFRRRFAVPIERYRDDAAAERLRRLARPFILRRLKSDPAIAADLPPKQEMAVVCTLTREQATLYQATVEEVMAKIERSEGIERRGLVLALLTALKQIANHPAQYLHERGPLPGRSGKLARLTEMLEETVDAGDRALVFTQFRQMGDRLVEHLQDTLGGEVLFLHGGVPRAARDEMVRRFQEEPRAPSIFVLSLRAGGTGLNLTRATRVFHFDRWWNPAVEDQATDRAHRIGQQRLVQVYRLLAAGTVEEKIDRMLVDKRALADRVVGAGETWITELRDDELRELVTLSRDATIEDAD